MQGRIRVLALWLSDALCISLAWIVAATAYHVFGDSDCGLADQLLYWAVYWPVILLFTGINAISRLYHGRWNYPAMPLSEVEEFRRLVLSAVSTHLLVMSILGFGHLQAFIARSALLFAGVLTAFAAQPFRYLARHLLAKLGWGQIPAYVVGEGVTADRVTATFAETSYYGFRIVRRFGRDDLRQIVDSGRAENVKHLFACYHDDRLFKAQFPELAQQFTFIEYLPTAESFPTSGAQVIEVGGLGGLEMTNQRKLKLLALEKSVLDQLLALAIFVFASPLFVIMPILIKLTSRGPVIYRAKRLGKKGRTIYVWKFRSMYADADKRLDALLASDPKLAAEFAADFKLKDDPRITPLGKFMRKTSIDELPQLFNVFAHEMALIGPRPIVEKEVEKYGKAYEIFSSVKPGITGLWQASGRNNTDYAARVALDVHYVLNWSPWMDVWIVFKTAISVLAMKGSY